ncbi:hypothetical protein [Nostoc sp. NMS4]|uniref:hypothetical protein n=1 Tax=Nostoc sp. NMS4 TaxID=2815390 RepID=UPI0025E96FD6|nr:hypothetical protein [Nostoc sp. NMS4]MBN3924631.1 hypothetical protein [Nostoc sp. NMS4]
MQQILDDFTEEEKNNYPIEQDDSFTPDQIEAILEHKKLAEKKIAKNNSVLRGLETFFWGISSYSLCKWLILNLGTNGISLAVALALITNQIVNRDCLDSFNLNRKDGQWETTGMDKLFKFIFGVFASAFVAWSSIGNFVGMVQDSKATYNVLNSAIEEFNSYSNKQQEEAIKGFVMGGSAVVLIIFVAKGKS